MAVRHARNTKWLAAALAVALAPWSAAHSGVLEDQLFQSVRNDDLAAVRSALDAGANVFATNVLGNRAADVAVDLGHFDVAHYLLSVMDHVQAAREAREEPAVVVPDPPSPVPVATQLVPSPTQQAPKPETAFDAAVADAVFTPVRAPAPEKTAMREAEMPAVPKILPAAHEVPSPPPVHAESPTEAQEKSIAGMEASASVSPPAPAPAPAPAPVKPKRTLDDIMRTASKADSALHVQPGTPVAKPPVPQTVSTPVVKPSPQTPPSQATPQPVGLFAKGASPQTQPAQEPVAPKPSSVAAKAEQPPGAPAQVPAMRKASVLHVDVGPSTKPATRMPVSQAQDASKADAPKENAPQKVTASVHSERLKAAQVRQPEKAKASREPEEDPGWFAKMKSYLGMGKGTKPLQTGGQAKAPTQAKITAPQAKITEPVQTAALTPSHRGPSPYKITADLALGRALPYDDLKGTSCVDKRRQGVVCMEPANWPKDLAPYFADMNSALYRGAKVVVGYRDGQATFLYAVFPSSSFKAVVGALSGRFGPPIKSQRGVRPLGEDLQANLVRTWSGTDENTGHPVALEVSMYDDQRGTFPVMDEGALKLTYTGSDSVFRYVEPIELQRFK